MDKENFTGKKYLVTGGTKGIAAVMWLSSDEAGFVIGHSLVLDGGFTVH